MNTRVETNVFPCKWYKIINTKEPIKQTKTKIESYGGYKLLIKYNRVLECKIKEIITDVHFIVVDHLNCDPITVLKYKYLVGTDN